MSSRLIFVEGLRQSVGAVQDALMAVVGPLCCQVSPSQMCAERRNAAVVFHSFLLELQAKKLDAD